MNKYVYHCSNQSNLKILKPNISTHAKNWLYATKDPIMSAVFLGTKGGDFTCAVGRDSRTTIPYICERFEGAFNLRYEGITGSIYTLPGEKFHVNHTTWNEEVVCNRAVIPLKETKIKNAKNYLLNLEKNNELIIKFYPEKIDGIPHNDKDLVERAVIWTKKFGNQILDEIKKYHPHLLEKILNELNNKEKHEL